MKFIYVMFKHKRQEQTYMDPILLILCKNIDDKNARIEMENPNWFDIWMMDGWNII